jgi:methyltransferase-like protein
LTNIKLSRLDLMDLDSSMGEFDYIIAHGLYTWVPAAVQDKLVSICKENLSEQGVAYISYNVYPGAHLRKMVREMMLFHVQEFTDPRQKITQAMALAKFLLEAQPKSDKTETYRRFISEEIDEALEHGGALLYHDDLGAFNSPVYFHEFMKHADQHELQFLGEADYFEMQDHIYPFSPAEILREMGKKDIILKEQYLDFIKCRRFRQTLLCHKGISLDRSPNPGLLRSFYIASPARPVSSSPDIASAAIEEFRGPRGARLATDFPLAKAAILHLGETYPAPTHFDDLLASACSLLNKTETSEEDALTLAEILLQTHAAGLASLQVHAPKCATEVSERPVASPLARLQLQSGSTVTTLRHENIVVQDLVGRRLLLLLDGTRDRNTLLSDLTSFLSSEMKSNPQKADSVFNAQKALDELAGELDKNLNRLARFGLLVA